MPTNYEDWSDMGLEDEYIRVLQCKKCGKERLAIEKELSNRGYSAREIRNVRELAKLR